MPHTHASCNPNLRVTALKQVNVVTGVLWQTCHCGLLGFCLPPCIPCMGVPAFFFFADSAVGRGNVRRVGLLGSVLNKGSHEEDSEEPHVPAPFLNASDVSDGMHSNSHSIHSIIFFLQAYNYILFYLEEVGEAGLCLFLRFLLIASRMTSSPSLQKMCLTCLTTIKLWGKKLLHSVPKKSTTTNQSFGLLKALFPHEG